LGRQVGGLGDHPDAGLGAVRTFDGATDDAVVGGECGGGKRCSECEYESVFHGSSSYIGGTWPFIPTFTRAEARLPSGWRCELTKTWAPGLSSLLSAGRNSTMTADSGTRTFFSPPLYCTVMTRSLPMAEMLATLALVILLFGRRSQ